MNLTNERLTSDENNEQSVERLERSRERQQQKKLMRAYRKEKKKRKALLALIWAFAFVIGICVCVLTVKVVMNLGENQNSAKTEKSEKSQNTVIADDKSQTPDKVFTPSEAMEEEKSPYEEFDYYKEENLHRYEDYASLNPQLSADEVVWRVNSWQDKPKYEFYNEVSGYDDITIIVNKYYKVPGDYRPPDLINVDGHLMRQETAEAYKKMKADAAAEGKNFYVVSAYRSVEYQSNLYNSYLAEDSKENVDRYSARAGFSEHHTGMALDLFGTKPGLREFENTPEYPWVRDNCYKYGFIIRYWEETEDITGYEAEPWHIRYVGTDVSTRMKEENIKTFEEYHAKYIQ